jgi:hypothetical protein
LPVFPGCQDEFIPNPRINYLMRRNSK